MCGRYVTKQEADIERFWNAQPRDIRDPLVPRFNAAPTQSLPVIRGTPARELSRLRWGLIPSWAKDAAIGAKMINARAETVAEKPSFRSAFKRRRCLVPMAGYYEWQQAPGGKVPHFIHLLNADQFAVAGLWESWSGAADAAPIESYTVITTAANELIARIHHRMPVILRAEDWDAWLDPQNERAAALQTLLQPYPADEMRARPVSTRVNSPRNDDAGLIEAAA